MSIHRETIYKQCTSALSDKKVPVRDGALVDLLPHLTNNPEIHDHLHHISHQVLYALEKGCNVQNACIAFQKIFIINPLLDTTQSTITFLTQILSRAIRDKQFEVYAAVVRTIGFILMLVSKFNPDKFTNVSREVLYLLNDVQRNLKYHYTHLADYSLPLLAGISCAYIALDMPYRKGFGYERIVPLIIFFMTKNKNPDVSAKCIPLCLNLLLIAIQAVSNKTIEPDSPAELVQTYSQHFITQAADDDGCYVEVNDAQIEPEDAKYDQHDLVYIPILQGGWDVDDLLARIELVFDGESLSLDNDYSEEDLDMINSFINEDLLNIREQLNSASNLKKIKNVLDKGHSDSLINQVVIPRSENKNELQLPELFNPHRHRFVKHYPKHYTNFEGRIVYFLLPLFSLTWDSVLNVQWMGDLLGSKAIEERIEQQIKEELKEIYDAEANQYERRMCKKEKDIAEHQSRDEKQRYMFDNTENEIQFVVDDGDQ